jgi:hypothetical protein
MTYIYSTKITRSKLIYFTISQDQKGLLQFGMGNCVADFSQKLLAYVIVQNYSPGGVSSIFLIIGNSGNFEFSRKGFCAMERPVHDKSPHTWELEISNSLSSIKGGLIPTAIKSMSILE